MSSISIAVAAQTTTSVQRWMFIWGTTPNRGEERGGCGAASLGRRPLASGDSPVRPLAFAIMHLEHMALLVDDYDSAIAFFVDALGFELAEDSPARTNDGRPKRWV